MRNCDIYNNTFYNSTLDGSSLMIENNSPGFRFFNNIFVYSEALLRKGTALSTELFQGNCYFNLSGGRSIAGFKDIEVWSAMTMNESLNGRMVGLFEDPGLQGPAGFPPAEKVILNRDGLESFCLKNSSPLIGRGLDLETIYNINPGTSDIAGTNFSKDTVFDIGALKHIGRK
jgi:hypothetical protein